MTLADGSMLLSLEIRTEVFLAVLLLLVTSHAFDSSLGLIWMPLAPTVKMPSVNGLFSTLFPACSWPLHGRMKLLCHSFVLLHWVEENSFPVIAGSPHSANGRKEKLISNVSLLSENLIFLHGLAK